MQTVNDLINLLKQLEYDGHGECEVMILNNIIQIKTTKGYNITLN